MIFRIVSIRQLIPPSTRSIVKAESPALRANSAALPAFFEHDFSRDWILLF